MTFCFYPRNCFFLFLTGFLLGIVWCLIWVNVLKNGIALSTFFVTTRPANVAMPDRKRHEGNGQNRDGPADWPENMTVSDFTSTDMVKLDYSFAINLTRSVRVLCLVTTTRSYHKIRALHIKSTWARRCNKLIFLSDFDDDQLGAIAVADNSDYSYLWGKVRKGFMWAYRMYGKDYDWFFKTDDDTYAIMENFRYLASQFSPDFAVCIGRRLQSVTPAGFLDGGAGYALSREALRLFYHKVNDPAETERCRSKNDYGAEDIEVSKCLTAAGVKFVSTLDSTNSQRFFPFTPLAHLAHRFDSNHWLSKFDFYRTENSSCCSDYAVTYHYVVPTEMYALDYLIYRLRPFGVDRFYS